MAMNCFQHNDICAVIVTFNPDILLVKNLRSLIPQVHNCLIVDNASNERFYLEMALDEFDVDLIQMESNSGIAKALNCGLDFCKENDYPLILTMDQDTVLDHDAVNALLDALNANNSVSVGINWDHSIRHDKRVDYLITSGNLLVVEAVTKVGGYDDNLFIDSVDFDLSLKLLDAGQSLYKVSRAGATHQLGEPQKGMGYITHSPERYYYISRNHYYILSKYWRTHVLFCMKKHVSFLVDMVRILLHDNSKMEKYRNVVRGRHDARKLCK